VRSLQKRRQVVESVSVLLNPRALILPIGGTKEAEKSRERATQKSKRVVVRSSLSRRKVVGPAEKYTNWGRKSARSQRDPPAYI